MKGIRNENARTSRERYSWLIGYNFGTDAEGRDMIYEGGYWDEETGRKQYEFCYYDKAGKYCGNLIVTYKGFREIIDKFDIPHRK